MMIGVYKAIVGAVPNVGAEITDVVPDGSLWRLVVVRLSLTTDATVTNRRVTVALDTGPTGQILLQTSANVDQGASTTFSYQVADFVGLESSRIIDSTLNLYGMPLPSSAVILRPGYRVRTITSALQAGDQFSQAIYYVEEWPS